jgi:hypothetical protein
VGTVEPADPGFVDMTGQVAQTVLDWLLTRNILQVVPPEWQPPGEGWTTFAPHVVRHYPSLRWQDLCDGIGRACTYPERLSWLDRSVARNSAIILNHTECIRLVERSGVCRRPRRCRVR